MKFATVLSVSMLTACANTTTLGGETEAELCRAWGQSLPTRSRADTDQTAAEIQEGYARFAAACPEFRHLIP